MNLLTGQRDEARQVDTNGLVARVEGLDRLLRAVAGRVPVDRLTTVRAVVDRAGERLRLSRDHTVVAVAGPTGSGKSSLFNALSGLDLSRVGYRRPTTAATHACVWNPSGADGLLDWLGVPERYRIPRETVLDGEAEAELRGLVLLDLPDFDSVEVTHQLEVDRVSGLADLLIWVLDPQKYADAVVHQRYLRGLGRYQGVTVVVLNQVDRLSGEDAERCLADVRRLLDEDGLPDVRLLATSVTTGEGIGELRQILIDTVAARQTSLQRLAGDVATAVDSVEHLVGPTIAEDAVNRAMVQDLASRLGDSVGAGSVAALAAATYRERGRRATSWPVARWFGRLRPGHRRSTSGHPDGRAQSKTAPGTGTPAVTSEGAARENVANGATPEAATAQAAPTERPSRSRHGVPEPSAAQRSQVDLAVRALADRVSDGLPEPWPEAIRAMARGRADSLPDDLERIVRDTDLGAESTPAWWWMMRVAQWVLAILALVGAGWLLALIVGGLLGFDVPAPVVSGLGVGPLPVATVVLAAGLVLGVLITVLGRSAVRRGARRLRSRAEHTLRSAIAEVAREQVVAPIREELHAYAEARDAVSEASVGGRLPRTD